MRERYVSRLYSLAPSPPWSAEEQTYRLRRLLRRLIAKHGADEVCRRVRAGVSDDELRVRLLVLAEAVARSGQRGGTI